MKLALIGLGTIGHAMRVWLEKHTQHELVLHDPGKGYIARTFSRVDASFVAVPVPTKRQYQDLKLDTVTLEAAVNCVEVGPVFVRSTVLPRVCKHLSNRQRPVIPMPEFLTASRAVDDFARLPIVVGGYEGLIQEIFPGKEVIAIHPEAASLAKYAHNVFCAMKVNHCNIIANAADHLGVPYQDVMKAANVTGFLGTEHLKVPGPDGRRGYGNHCLSKDVAAFLGFLRDNDLRGSETIASCEVDNALFRAEEAGTWIQRSSLQP